MFRKILLPLDFTEENEPALRLAAGLAAQAAEPADLVLLHVIETLHDIPFDEMRGFYDKLERRARKNLAEQAAAFGSLAVRYDVVFGRRPESIVTYAAEHGADLILLSSHRLSADRPAGGIGSISHKVAVLAECPVLLVK